MAHILSYGSLNLDLVYQVPHFVQAGETLSSTSRTVHCGGDGLVQPLAARVLGIAFCVDRLARAAEMVDGVDVIDIQRAKIDDVHRMNLHRWNFL